MDKWYNKSGNEGDVVISTRIRFARNLKDYPFPCRLNDETKCKVTALVKDAILNGNSALASRFEYIQMPELTQEEAVSLVERHLVSPEFISDRQGRGLLLLDDESVSVMINEEDHIRIQVMHQGLDLTAAYDIADKIDTLLDERLNFAFNDKLGYLTQCPTNLGTGMRASLMLHLPGLQQSKAMNRIASTLSKLGLVLRGMYGEGSEPKGALYQLSNQVTLGISEEQAMSNLRDVALQLVAQEREARNNLTKNIEVIDAISRSYGLSRYARLMSNEECMKLLSNIRFGIAAGIIDKLDFDIINRLMIETQPATLMKNVGKKLSPSERDRIRADVVRSTMLKTNIPNNRRLEN